VVLEKVAECGWRQGAWRYLTQQAPRSSVAGTDDLLFGAESSPLDAPHSFSDLGLLSATYMQRTDMQCVVVDAVRAHHKNDESMVRIYGSHISRIISHSKFSNKFWWMPRLSVIHLGRDATIDYRSLGDALPIQGTVVLSSNVQHMARRRQR
jgi:hypothetical protein